ncbi:MAG: hypothetical protein PHW76_02125 [Alphaproteobacteria bacterium]|nr:hypothetical protein [Alphaproteobacteria bacterium]
MPKSSAEFNSCKYFRHLDSDSTDVGRKSKDNKIMEKAKTTGNAETEGTLWGFTIPHENILTEKVWPFLVSSPASNPSASGVLPAIKNGEYYVIGMDEQQIDLCRSFLSVKHEVGGKQKIPTSPQQIKAFKARLSELCNNN